MPQFTYRARDYSGNLFDGSITAGDTGEVAAYLRERNLIIVRVDEVAVRKGALDLSKLGRVSRRDMGVFCRQLAVMTNAGVPLLRALGVLRTQAGRKALQEALGEVCTSLEVGESLASSLSHHAVFPGVLVKMIEAGESGGVLASVLEQMADFFEWEHNIREKVKSSLIYPGIVLCVAAAAVFLVVTFVIPVFQGILNQFEAQTPLITRVILGISSFFSNFWFYLLPITVAVVLWVNRLLATERGHEIKDILLLKTPIVGGLLKKTITARFCRTLSILLKGGVPVLEALTVVEKTTGNYVFQHSISKARESIRRGEVMTTPLKESSVFPPLVIEMISVGEETGTVDIMLEKAGHFYDLEVEDMAVRLSTMIEPVLIIIMGGIVGLILLSVFLPLFKIITSVR